MNRRFARWSRSVNKEFFPPRPSSRPTIYAYEDTNPQNAGLLKIGYTTRTAKQRLEEIYPIKAPGKPPYQIHLEESAMRNDGTAFTDHDVHRYLQEVGIKNPGGEWFRCTVEQVKAADHRGQDRATKRGKPLARFQDAAGTESGGRERPPPISEVSERRITTSLRTSSGTLRCGSAKPLPRINWR